MNYIKHRWLNSFNLEKKEIEGLVEQAKSHSDEKLHNYDFFELQLEKDKKWGNPKYSIHIVHWEDLKLIFVFSAEKLLKVFHQHNDSEFSRFRLQGLAVHEEGITATVKLVEENNLTLMSFSSDYFLQRDGYDQIGTNIEVCFSGWILTGEHQLAPPSIEKNGKKITTAGSSIVIPSQGKHADEYIFQFRVLEVKEINCWGLTSIMKIKTRLAVLPQKIIPLTLFAPRAVFQNNYYPQVGHDITGIFILSNTMKKMSW